MKEKKPFRKIYVLVPLCIVLALVLVCSCFTVVSAGREIRSLHLTFTVLSGVFLLGC